MTRLCALYGVTRAGYYAWRARPSSAHAAQDRQLQQHIHRLFQQHHGAYGSPRLQRALRAEGWAVSRRRVARLMRAAGLRARVAQLYRANPRLHRFFGQHPNRLWARVARRPNQIWVGDITYVPTWEGWLFLATVIDCHTKEVIGWAMNDNYKTPLIEAANVSKRFAASESDADAPVSRQRARAREHQIAHSGEAGEGLQPSAQRHAELRDLVQPARHKRSVGIEAKSEALEDAGGDGDDVLQ